MIIIEDGTGLQNSNSYASIATANEYCDIRNIAVWETATTIDKMAALIRATDFIDSAYIFRSVISNDDQALQNPRFGETALSARLITATIELAIIALSQDLFAQPSRGILSKEVQAGKVMSKTVFDPASTKDDGYPAITKILKGIANRAGSSVQIGQMTR